MDDRSPSSFASSSAARAKVVPKTKKKPPPTSLSAAPAQTPVKHFLVGQVPTISSDSDGSIDDIVFDNTGMGFSRWHAFLTPMIHNTNYFPVFQV